MRTFFVELTVDEQAASKPDFFGVPWYQSDPGDLPSAIVVECESIDIRGSWLSFMARGGLVLGLPSDMVYVVRELQDVSQDDNGWRCQDCSAEYGTPVKECHACGSQRIEWKPWDGPDEPWICTGCDREIARKDLICPFCAGHCLNQRRT